MAEANEGNLSERWPELPDELTDRQQDAAESLLAIGDLAGPAWASRARRSLTNVIMGSPESSDDSLRLRLLSDTRRVFAGVGYPERVRSADLVTALQGLEDGPWAEGLDKPLSQTKMARLLKPYDIEPKQLRFGETTGKGYERSPLEDAWARYLPEAEGDAESKREADISPSVSGSFPGENGTVSSCFSSSSSDREGASATELIGAGN